MKSYDEMIQTAAEELYIIVRSGKPFYCERWNWGFSDAIAAMFDKPEDEVWDDVRKCAREMTEKAVTDGDTRAMNAWNNYWN